jgi:hypothetical protein
VSSHQLAQPQKRRSTRLQQAIPLLVQGVGALREPYQEEVSTLSISCHGCTYQSKHEVIQGETVYLDIKPPAAGAVGCSSKARVKWAQKLNAKERIFQIAVELENAGNVWGVASPPTDWFPLKISEALEPAIAGRELKVVTRKEQQVVPSTSGGGDQVSQLARSEGAASSMTPLAQLMVVFGEQIQSMASEAAAAALVKEKGRLLEEFRSQLRDEALKAIQSAIFASKEVIARQTAKELSEAHEAAARDSHALWRKKIEQDMESARQHMQVQGKEVSQRLDTLAAGTIERVQSKMDATRSEAVDRFVSRIREQIAPMLEVAKDSLQRLEGAEIALRKESEAIFAGIENQLVLSTNESLAKALENLERNAAAQTAKANETLLQLYQNFESTTTENVESLLGSLGSQMAKILQEKAAEVSNEFSKGIEGYTRSYLESIGKSIAEIPQNMPAHSRQ